MTDFKINPRVLIVTPEVAYLPHGIDMDNPCPHGWLLAAFIDP
jgi:hypothetical protein